MHSTSALCSSSMHCSLTYSERAIEPASSSSPPPRRGVPFLRRAFVYRVFFKRFKRIKEKNRGKKVGWNRTFYLKIGCNWGDERCSGHRHGRRSFATIHRVGFENLLRFRSKHPNIDPILDRSSFLYPCFIVSDFPLQRTIITLN